MRSRLFLTTVIFSSLTMYNAQAQIRCGATIEPSNQPVIMDRDLTCSGGSLDNALTLRGPVTLKMRGHSITCNGDDNDGVRFLEIRAKLIGPGRLIDCDDSIKLFGDGAHTVKKITISGNLGSLADGIASTSPANKIIRNVIKDIGDDGIDLFSEADSNRIIANRIFRVGGDGISSNDGAEANLIARNILIDVDAEGIEAGIRAKVKKNTIIRSGDSGIIVEPDATNAVLVKNTITRAGESGIEIPSGSSNNAVRRNQVEDSRVNAILVELGSSQNKISRNRATGSVELDLVDENRNCGSNTWSNNTFGTKSNGRACIK